MIDEWLRLEYLIGNSKDAVEYASWITASVIAIIAFTTIFLGQYYDRKSYKIQEIIYKFKSIDFQNSKELYDFITEYKFLLNNDSAFIKAKNIYFQACIVFTLVWLVNYFYFLYLYCSLLDRLIVLVATFAFIYFVWAVNDIFKDMENKTEGKYKNLPSIADLLNLGNCTSNYSSRTDLFSLADIKYHITVNMDDNSIDFKYISELPIHNFSICLPIKIGNYEIYIYTKLAKFENDIEPNHMLCQTLFSNSEETSIKKVRKIFFENKVHNEKDLLLQFDNEFYYYEINMEHKSLGISEIFSFNTVKNVTNRPFTESVKEKLISLEPNTWGFEVFKENELLYYYEDRVEELD
ncbi:hypothetical protein [Salipaludibacillus aurantiacus]|uniref:Uncharacterized protein n=1 Tax=Salipaludibacillus aurantiacus TaxID=1601833 RepID=A0A1H9UVE2_9BACI|nr:hypothetical protein [Salipaludibacillus aurantiacus]SES13104.1 hypothetical protein SAMN05518684_108187 [Salipaludibacillus aurantiacus]